jgi:hypothetical protein
MIILLYGNIFISRAISAGCKNRDCWFQYHIFTGEVEIIYLCMTQNGARPVRVLPDFPDACAIPVQVISR